MDCQFQIPLAVTEHIMNIGRLPVKYIACKYLSHDLSRNFLNCHVLSKTLVRSINDSVSKSETRLRLQDELPESHRLVYKGPMNNYAVVAHAASTGSFLGFGALATWKIATLAVIGAPISTLLYEQLAVFSPLEVGCTLTAFFLANISLWLVSSRCVLRIYTDQQTKPSYHCVMIGSLPMMTQRFKFGPGELKEATGLVRKFPWRHCCFQVGSKNLVLLEQYFRTPADLQHMLGE
ncbi:hypothetical protein B566_EDAN002964 [Ephemera danica]|nr:hypothetical protein B566_EDAN002964 [Ephemera danica]